ncbi:DUF721 domain-containing protein [Spirillospora sp. NPDC050679]
MTDDPQDVHDSADGAGAPGPPAPPAKTGIELAREALAQAKADALKRGTLPGQGGKKKRGTRPAPVRDPGRGGDPKAFGAAIRDLLATRGWEQRAAVGGVFGNWPGIVGPELAEHTRPERFENGVLTVVADSTTWATQLRLLAATLVRRLNEELGQGTVRQVKVQGPSAGPRRTGAWRVR